jgi:hypothetical protein
MAPAGVQAEHRSIGPQEDPQPPAMSRLAFLIDQDHPARFIGLSERRAGVPLQEGLIKWLEQRFQALQTTRDGTSRHVQTQEPPMAQQPLGGAVTGELVEQDLLPH